MKPKHNINKYVLWGLLTLICGLLGRFTYEVGYSIKDSEPYISLVFACICLMLLLIALWCFLLFSKDFLEI